MDKASILENHRPYGHSANLLDDLKYFASNTLHAARALPRIVATAFCVAVVFEVAVRFTEDSITNWNWPLVFTLALAFTVAFIVIELLVEGILVLLATAWYAARQRFSTNIRAK